jgi:DNA-binding CsgD family transcriptional regulator
MALITRRNESARWIFGDDWEAAAGALGRLGTAIGRAENELLNLHRAYTQLAEAPIDPDDLGQAIVRCRLLSAQEQRVADLLVAGRRNLEIALAHHVSVNTVKTQVRSILRKLCIRSRWQVREAMKDTGGHAPAAPSRRTSGHGHRGPIATTQK